MVKNKILQCFKVWWYVGGSGPTVEEFGVRRLLGNSKAHQPTTLLMNIILIIISIIIILVRNRLAMSFPSKVAETKGNENNIDETLHVF